MSKTCNNCGKELTVDWLAAEIKKILKTGDYLPYIQCSHCKCVLGAFDTQSVDKPVLAISQNLKELGEELKDKNDQK